MVKEVFTFQMIKNKLRTHMSIASLTSQTLDGQRKMAYKSTYIKLVVQWLNVALCYVSSAVLVDIFRLPNRQLLVAAKRQAVKKLSF